MPYFPLKSFTSSQYSRFKSLFTNNQKRLKLGLCYQLRKTKSTKILNRLSYILLNLISTEKKSFFLIITCELIFQNNIKWCHFVYISRWQFFFSTWLCFDITPPPAFILIPFLVDIGIIKYILDNISHTDN